MKYIHTYICTYTERANIYVIILNRDLNILILFCDPSNVIILFLSTYQIKNLKEINSSFRSAKYMEKMNLVELSKKFS